MINDYTVLYNAGALTVESVTENFACVVMPRAHSHSSLLLQFELLRQGGFRVCHRADDGIGGYPVWVVESVK
jgi:hypothetical protein